MIEIKFKTSGWSSAFGSFATGDLVRCSAEQARHFVDEAGAAEYVKPVASEPSQEPAEEADNAPKRRGKKAE